MGLGLWTSRRSVKFFSVQPTLLYLAFTADLKRSGSFFISMINSKIVIEVLQNQSQV